MQNPVVNPLLDTEALPRFSAIRPEHIKPALEQVLAENRAAIARLVGQGPPRTWENFIRPLEDLHDRLEKVWGPVSHLHAVADSEALREAYNACLPLLSDYYAEFSHTRGLYQGYRDMADSSEFARMEPGQRRNIENELRDFHLNGIDLEPAAQDRYKQIQQELSRLMSKFSENLLDATRAWTRHLTDESQLAGLPDSAKALARHQAEEKGLSGWLLTLNLPCYLPVMNYADDPALRREIYYAYSTRASEVGPNAGEFDNGPVMEQILALRHELAQLLGFENYAHYSLAPKMARSPGQVLEFLNELAAPSLPVARAEFEELKAFARQHYGVEHLDAWDVMYYSEKLRQHTHDISQESLRPYFPLPRVLEGLFRVAHRLYGISVERQDADTWHPDVSFFDVFDENGELRAQFYLDLYVRDGKRSGAWMADAIGRKRRTDGGIQIPVAYVCCNFSPPMGDQPSLLTHQDVITLFHEFGHALHHMLTRVEYAGVAGINGVPWDAVELPSQFMENWCWQREAVDLLARHWRDHHPLPEDLFQKLVAARNFQAGISMVRQLEFSLFDMRLFHEYRPDWGRDIQSLLNEVRRAVAVIMPPDFNRFANNFGHIFAGGYAAGYYSYKWAEVLSADAFSRFEEEGIFSPGAGRDFLRHILEQGGSRDPLELFTAFRGREPCLEPLLRHSGIVSAEARQAHEE